MNVLRLIMMGDWAGDTNKAAPNIVVICEKLHRSICVGKGRW